MLVNHYLLIKKADGCFYEFESEGPKGKIKKVVQYHRIRGYPREVFNLSFGDWNESDGRIADDVSSNNRDRDKVLATVATTVIEFTLDFPDAIVFAEGSTRARTRLYQMGISKYWDAISQNFDLQGYTQGQWEDFRKGVNYECFLLERKRNGNFKKENTEL